MEIGWLCVCIFIYSDGSGDESLLFLFEMRSQVFFASL